MYADAVIDSLHRGKVLATSVPASDETRLAWIGIYPLDLSQPLTAEFLRNQGMAALPSAGPAYHIRSFEVDRTLIERDACIAEPEMTNKRSYFAFGDEDLMARLTHLGVAIEQFDLPFKSNYPI